MKDTIVPHLPIYCRPPNKLLRYEIRGFTDCNGNHPGKVRVAIYKDKSGNIQEHDAQVLWG